MLSRHQPMRRTAVVVMMQVLWSCLVYALVRQDAAHAFVFQTTYYSARPPASGSPPFAFTVQGCTRRSICCFAKSINKQAELRRKMEQAKRQKTKQQQQEDNDISTSSSQKTKESLTDREIKEQNDRLRFEELLKRESANVLNDYSSDGYLTRQQEEEEIVAAISGIERIFEGDPAPVECFEELVGIISENAIGSAGKERLVPWLGKKGSSSSSSGKKDDYLVVLTDPRPKSYELQQTVKNLQAELPADIRARLVVINADSPAENRRWLKKSQLLSSSSSSSSPSDGSFNNDEMKLQVYSDEKMEWMRTYTSLGEKRWSMTMFVLSNERVQKVARDVDQYGAAKTIRNAVRALREMRL